jgi:hypothetical protein
MRVKWDQEARRALLQSVTDMKLEQAWEETLDHHGAESEPPEGEAHAGGTVR